MTRDEARAMAALMLAYADGRTVQYRERNWANWREASGPAFNFDQYEYRIKPEPKDMWVNEYEGITNTWTYPSKKLAMDSAGLSAIRVAVHYREVCDE